MVESSQLPVSGDYTGCRGACPEVAVQVDSDGYGLGWVLGAGSGRRILSCGGLFGWLVEECHSGHNHRSWFKLGLPARFWLFMGKARFHASWENGLLGGLLLLDFDDAEVC